jgi:hypothetical protein
MVKQSKKYKPKPYKWFLERIGKRIYRDSDGCHCRTCNDIVRKGLVIADKNHAQYLAEVDAEFAESGTHLNYKDKKD